MNERLKKIWEESTGKAWPQSGNSGDPNYQLDQLVAVAGYDLEEFAKLIVKECGVVAVECDITEYGDFREGISQELKQHFGFEKVKTINSFKNYCTCGGYAWTINGRDRARPHMSWCPQAEEYNEWFDSVGYKSV